MLPEPFTLHSLSFKESKLKINKQPAEVFAVFIDAVVFLLDMLLIKKSEYALLKLAGSFSGDDLHSFDLFLDRLVDDPLQLTVDLVSFIVDVVQVELQFGHGCSFSE